MPKVQVQGRSGKHECTGVYLKDGTNMFGTGETLDPVNILSLYDILEELIEEKHIIAGYEKFIDTIGKKILTPDKSDKYEYANGRYEIMGPAATNGARKSA